MTISKIYEMKLINDDTEIMVRDSEFHVLAQGNWYQDNVLDYRNSELESFTWQDDNKIFIDLK